MSRYKQTFNPCDECNYSYSKNNELSSMCKICEFKSYLDLELTLDEILFLAKFFKKQTSADSIKANRVIVEKLAELSKYKDLEEQGRLIESQYMVGETVWCLKEDYDYDWDAVGYKFMGMCGDYIIVTSEYMGMTFKEQLDEMCEETMESENPSIYIFHKSRVFLTKEEAEAKLAEMESK